MFLNFSKHPQRSVKKKANTVFSIHLPTTLSDCYYQQNYLFIILFHILIPKVNIVYEETITYFFIIFQIRHLFKNWLKIEIGNCFKIWEIIE